MTTLIADQVLDCSGMACPMPIIKTKKAMDALQVGQVLKLISTDPGSVPDIDAFTRRTGHLLLNHATEGKAHIFYIRKA